MAGESSVVLNQNSTVGASASTYQSTDGRQHQEVVVQTQAGSSDPVSVSSANPLPVNIVSGGGTGGTAQADASAFTRGTTLETPIAGAVDSTAPTLTAGKASALSLNTAGSLRTVDQGTQVDATAFTRGTGSTAVIAGAVSTSSPSLTNGNSGALSLDTSGNLRVNVVAGGGSGGTSLTDAATFTRGTTAETPIGGIVESSNPTLTAGHAGALSLDTSGNLRVNVIAGGGTGGTSITDAAAFTRGTTLETPIGGIVETSVPTLTNGKAGAFSLTTSGELRTVVDNGISVGTTSAPSSQLVSITPVAAISGGATRSSSRITATAPAVVTVKSSAGQLFYLAVVNTTGTVAFLHFYDVSGSITLGTTSDTDVHAIPASTTGSGFVIPVPMGLVFANKIAFSVTGGVAAADNTALAVSSSAPITVNAGYA